ncbi:MAG: hypothetical protein EOP62_12955 [Sphingomonadales bacterium]|nr:MAG: hypothetical protein EOP62_12955 [Sphingomonadales bacterium]
MSIVLAAGLFAAMTAAEPILSLEHRAQVEHASGTVDAQYRSRVSLSRSQVGTPAKPGMASSLRCDWRADIVVEREARLSSGSLLSRSIADSGVVTVSRPGWYTKQDRALTKQIAGREDELRGHAMRMAQSDEAQLRAEIERLGTAG